MLIRGCIHAIHASNHLFPSPKDLKLSSLSVVHGKDHDEIHPFVGLEGVMKVKYRKGRVQYSSLHCFLLKKVCFKSVTKWASKETMVSFFKNLTRSVDFFSPFLGTLVPVACYPCLGVWLRTELRFFGGTPSSLLQPGRKKLCQKSPAPGHKTWVFLLPSFLDFVSISVFELKFGCKKRENSDRPRADRYKCSDMGHL